MEDESENNNVQELFTNKMELEIEKSDTSEDIESYPNTESSFASAAYEDCLKGQNQYSEFSMNSSCYSSSEESNTGVSVVTVPQELDEEEAYTRTALLDSNGIADNELITEKEFLKRVGRHQLAPVVCVQYNKSIYKRLVLQQLPRYKVQKREAQHSADRHRKQTMDLLNQVRECRNQMKKRFIQQATDQLSVQQASGLAKTLFIQQKWMIYKKRIELYAKMQEECAAYKKKKGRRPKDAKENQIQPIGSGQISNTENKNNEHHQDQIKQKSQFRKFNRMIKDKECNRNQYEFQNIKKHAKVNTKIIEYFKAFFNNNPGNLVYEENYNELWYFFKYKSENKKSRIIDHETIQTLLQQFEDRIIPKHTQEKQQINGGPDSYKKLYHPIHPYSTALQEESRRLKKKPYHDQLLKEQREKIVSEKLRLAHQNTTNKYDSDSDTEIDIATDTKNNSNSNKRKRKLTVKLKTLDGSEDGMDSDSDVIEEEMVSEQLVFKRRQCQLNGQLLQGGRIVRASNYNIIDQEQLLNSLHQSAQKILNYKENVLNQIKSISEGSNTSIDVTSQDDTLIEVNRALQNCADYAAKSLSFYSDSINELQNLVDDYPKQVNKDASFLEVQKAKYGIEIEKWDCNLLLMLWVSSLDLFFFKLLFKLFSDNQPLEFVHFSKDSFFQKNPVLLDTELQVAQVVEVEEATSYILVDILEDFNQFTDTERKHIHLDLINQCYFLETDLVQLKVKEEVYNNFINAVNKDGIDPDDIEINLYQQVNQLETSSQSIPLVILILIDFYKDNNVYENVDSQQARILGTNHVIKVSSRNFVVKRSNKILKSKDSDDKIYDQNNWLKTQINFQTKDQKKSLMKLRNVTINEKNVNQLSFFSTRYNKSQTQNFQILHNWSTNNPAKELIVYLVNADQVGSWYALKRGELQVDATRFRSDKYNEFNNYNKKILFEVGYMNSYSITCIFRNQILQMQRHKTPQGYRCTTCFKTVTNSNQMRCFSCAKCQHTDEIQGATAARIKRQEANFEIKQLMSEDQRYNATQKVQWECQQCLKCTHCLQAISKSTKRNIDNYAFIDNTELHLGIDYVICTQCESKFHLNCLQKKEVIAEENAYIEQLRNLNFGTENYPVNMQEQLRESKRNYLEIVCTNCLSCTDCQSSQLSLHDNEVVLFTKSQEQCDKCLRLRDKGENCTHCHRLCKDNEESVYCNYCQKWFHRNCEHINDTEWGTLTDNKDHKQRCYYCKREKLVDRIREYINKLAKFDEECWFQEWLEIYNSANQRKIIERPICIERIQSLNEKNYKQVYSVAETSSSNARFKVVEFVKDLLLITENAKKFNRSNEGVQKAATNFENRLVHHLSSSGLSKTLIPYIERNDQLNLFELLRGYSSVENPDKKNKKFKSKLQKINPLVKSSGRGEYFHLEPVVNSFSQLRQLLQPQCLKCGGLITGEQEQHCVSCQEQFHRDCLFPCASNDYSPSPNFQCLDCRKCRNCANSMSDQEEKKEIILKCFNSKCSTQPVHQSCIEPHYGSQVNTQFIPYIAYKQLCNDCFKCRICAKFSPKSPIQGLFEIKDRPYLNTRTSQVLDQIERQGQDNTLCIVCFVMTLVSKCELCDVKIFSSQTNEELAIQMKEKVSNKLILEYLNCSICLKKFHLRCLKNRNSGFNFVNNDFYYECRNCINSKSISRSLNFKHVQFIHKYLSSLIRTQFSKQQYHTYRLLYDYWFQENKQELMENPFVKQIIDKFKFGGAKRRKSAAKPNLTNHQRVAHESLIMNSDYNLNSIISAAKAVDLSPYSHLEYISRLFSERLQNKKIKDEAYWKSLDYPTPIYVYLKKSIFKDDIQYETLFENQNHFIYTELVNNNLEPNQTRLMQKYNYHNQYSSNDPEQYYSNEYLKQIRDYNSQQETITMFLYRRIFTIYYQTNTIIDQQAGVNHIKHLTWHICNSKTEIESLNQTKKFVSESFHKQDLIVNDISNLYESKTMYQNSLKLLYYSTDVVTNYGDLGDNDKQEQYLLIQSIQAVIKSSFNEFQETDQFNTMIKLLHADMYTPSQSTSTTNELDQATEPIGNRQEPNLKCSLCGYGEDVDIQEKSQRKLYKSKLTLIPCFSTQVHKVCVLQSPHVIELQDGSLLNVPQLQIISKSEQCRGCMKGWGHIKCMACHENWHLPCLLAHGGVVHTRQSNMCFCNQDCLEKYNSDLDQMQPLQTLSQIQYLEPQRFMQVARLDADLVDWQSISKHTATKRSSQITGLFNRIGEQVVLNQGSRTPDYEKKIQDNFYFPQHFAFMRKIQVGQYGFIIVCEQGQENLVDAVIIHLGNSQGGDVIDSNTHSYSQQNTVLQLVNNYKNALNNHCGHNFQKQLTSDELYVQNGFKKTIRELFNPEHHKYSIVESNQGNLTSQIADLLRKELNLDLQQLVNLGDDKFTLINSPILQNWFYYPLLVTDHETDLQINLCMTPVVPKERTFDPSSVKGKQWVRFFGKQFKAMLNRPQECNEIGLQENERGITVCVKDNLKNLAKPRFNLQNQEKFHTAQSQFKLSSRHIPISPDCQVYEKMSVRERYELFQKDKTYKFVSSLSKIHGIGLFATHTIRREEIIVDQLGEVVSEAQSDAREKVYEKLLQGGCYMFSLEDNYIIDGSVQGNYARYINHSCQPNSQASILNEDNYKLILIIANTDIERGTEITYDYKYAQEGNEEKCYCGSPNCFSRLN